MVLIKAIISINWLCSKRRKIEPVEITNRSFVRALSLLSLVLCLSACVQSQSFRTDGIVSQCYIDLSACEKATIEKHLEFDIAFIEFTQRGNLFDRNRTESVIDYINKQAGSEHGAAVFVFVHGWKHNAASNDTNVVEFREMLSRAAENPFVGKRRVIGVYLGWRGKVTNLPFVKELSYWGRKSVAEEIGSGGATEVLAELQQVLIEQYAGMESNETLYKNTFVIIGHSFGGAIVLTALHDVLLAELIATYRQSQRLSLAECNKVRRFADGVILVNPAIEANRMILLREAAAKCKFKSDQPSLMHVISSEADLATNVFFPIGQYINVTTSLSPEKLLRTINDKEVVLNEHQLDVTTVGNYDQFRSGFLYHDEASKRWAYKSCRQDIQGCGVSDPQKQKNHIKLTEFDPISFIKTDANFIKNHNDVFSCYMQSYITTVMFETQVIDRKYASATESNVRATEIGNCDHQNFDFSSCFNNQLYDYNCELVD